MIVASLLLVLATMRGLPRDVPFDALEEITGIFFHGFVEWMT